MFNQQAFCTKTFYFFYYVICFQSRPRSIIGNETVSEKLKLYNMYIAVWDFRDVHFKRFHFFNSCFTPN